MTKWVAEFDIPDGHLIGAAYAKTCPDDIKIRSDKDFKTVYADTQKRAIISKKNSMKATSSVSNAWTKKNWPISFTE